MIAIDRADPSSLLAALKTVRREFQLKRHEAKHLLRQIGRLNPAVLQLKRK